jgi:predicted acylesterase/phospholipase RssA
LIVKVLYIYGHRLVESSLQGADVVIAPPVTHIAVAEFHHAAECIREEKLAAEASMAEVADRLGRS